MREKHYRFGNCGPDLEKYIDKNISGYPDNVLLSFLIQEYFTTYRKIIAMHKYTNSAQRNIQIQQNLTPRYRELVREAKTRNLDYLQKIRTAEKKEFSYENRDS